MAIQAAKAADGEPREWSVSTEKIHSSRTHEAYNRVVREYAQWCKTQGVHDISEMDARAHELVTNYLETKKVSTARDGHGHDTGRTYSAWTLALHRSGLRMYYQNRIEGGRAVGGEVQLPIRKRETIRNNRHVDLSNGGHVSVEKHADLIRFLACTGLREKEIRALRVKHVSITSDVGGLLGAKVYVANGKGGKTRNVVPLGDHAWIADLTKDRGRHDLLFETIPWNLPIHVLRRQFSQTMYCELSGRELPHIEPPRVRLSRKDYDLDAALKVSAALGHNRAEVVLVSYLR